jgi:hypothetical protein
VLWCCCVVVLLCCCVVVLWCCGVVVLWCCGVVCCLFSSTIKRQTLSPKRTTQRACAVTVYRLSTDPLCRTMLVEQGGIRSVISLLHRHHHVLANEPEHGVAASSAEFNPSMSMHSVDSESVRESRKESPSRDSEDQFAVLLSRESLFTAQLQQEQGRGMGMGLGMDDDGIKIDSTGGTHLSSTLSTTRCVAGPALSCFAEQLSAVRPSGSSVLRELVLLVLVCMLLERLRRQDRRHVHRGSSLDRLVPVRPSRPPLSPWKTG